MFLFVGSPACCTMQGYRGPDHVASPSNGSAPYAMTRVLPVRTPPPIKSPPPPPARPKLLAPPPAHPPAAHLPELHRRQRIKNTYICTGICFGVLFLVLILVLALSPREVLDGETHAYCSAVCTGRVNCSPNINLSRPIPPSGLETKVC